ncbi:MAG: hypothetical protein A2234_10485 [Elusimicrobia bacterium RIFOXYA2_FULL_58_8]|nr:MAG: hypothetical protein A2285_09640 [Elusimicrobia bacterium RIFOXYA12_FULL_57_11]OGS14862.1 MAG: hypothetical protein A2234_10485 [Elusimicrobia bacterium RIFOXYA2_FULL_58_8]
MRDNIYNTLDTFLEGRRPQSDTDYAAEWIPEADVAEDKDGFTVYVALPGVKREAIETEIKENILIISGRKALSPEVQKLLVRQEITTGRFYRAFKIGVQVRSSAVRASLKDGVLEVRLPKSEEAKPNKILIS